MYICALLGYKSPFGALNLDMYWFNYLYMKNFIRLFAILLSALFVGVACNPDNNGGDNGPVDDFTVTFDNVGTTTADVTCTPADKDMTYICIQVSKAVIENFETPKAYAEYLVTSYYAVALELQKGVFKHTASSSEPAYVMAFGATRDADYNYTFTTDVYVFEIPFVPMPILTIESLEHSVACEAGVLELPYSVENPIGGAKVTVSANSKHASWVVPTIGDGVITINYEANNYKVARATTIEFTYEGLTKGVSVTIEQAANANAVPISFALSVSETHFNHAIVSVTPSDKSVKYVLKAVSKTEYEGLRYNGDDKTLQKEDLSSYYAPATLTGDQTNYKLDVDASDYYGWEWYIYVYAVSDDVKTALSDVEKVLVTIVNDAPVLTLETKTLKVSAEGGKYTVKYTLDNPIEGGELRINGTITNYYGVLDTESVVLDTEACEITFTVNPYDAEQYSHYAIIPLAYYDSKDAKYSVLTANLRVEQIDPIK